MDIREMHNREVEHWKGQYRRTVRLCKAIYDYSDYIALIKKAIEAEDLTEASVLFNEIDFETQSLLLIAPSKGGPFTTKERAEVTKLWDVQIQDIEDK